MQKQVSRRKQTNILIWSSFLSFSTSRNLPLPALQKFALPRVMFVNFYNSLYDWPIRVMSTVMCRGHGYIVCVTCLRLCLDSTKATTTTARSSSNYKHYYFILCRVWHFLEFYLSERIMRIMMRDAYTKGLQFCPLSPTPPSLSLSPRFPTHVSSIRSVSSSQHFYLIPCIICA